MKLYLLLFVAVSASLLSSSVAETSSSSAREWRYDVFLSFRGLDTRQSVAFELYDRLHRRGIKTFMDDPHLLGHPISPLSMLQSKNQDGNKILPIFYRVEPSDVRHRRNFEEAFTKHENSGQHTSEKVQQWRDALENMASISGWHTQNFRSDRELVDAVVDFVCRKVLPTAVESTRDVQAFEQTRPRPTTQEERLEEVPGHEDLRPARSSNI
ncbi:hypothetical protein M0R45_025218 [Rubus argutus]|uniref:TIR domain-containing protein n=1 Tax=Rubus argutus TaxID=59490 RepID=A0AAW1WWC0_RUBAR